MSSQPTIQVLTKEKEKGKENDPLKQVELDCGTSEVESDSDVGMIAITSSLRQKFARFYHVHGTNQERRRWKEEHRSQKCTNCALSNLPCTTTSDLKIRCSECHAVSVACSKMDMFRRDLMMQKMGIWEAEVWETLNREFLRESKRKREDFVESEDDEEDELESDEEECKEEGYGKPSVRGKSDPEKSPAKKPPRKVEVVIQTCKQRGREEKQRTETVAYSSAGLTSLSEISRPGGMNSPKNQPVETRARKKQRLLTEKTQAEEKNDVQKRVTALSISIAANPATPFSLMPSPTGTSSQNAVPATSSQIAPPAPTPPLCASSSALQVVSSVPQVPPPAPAANDLEFDLRLSVIKRQLEDLCSDFRYGRIDVESALGSFDEVAARIGRRASVASG